MCRWGEPDTESAALGGGGEVFQTRRGGGRGPGGLAMAEGGEGEPSAAGAVGEPSPAAGGGEGAVAGDQAAAPDPEKAESAGEKPASEGVKAKAAARRGSWFGAGGQLPGGAAAVATGDAGAAGERGGLGRSYISVDFGIEEAKENDDNVRGSRLPNPRAPRRAPAPRPLPGLAPSHAPRRCASMLALADSLRGERGPSRAGLRSMRESGAGGAPLLRTHAKAFCPSNTPLPTPNPPSHFWRRFALYCKPARGTQGLTGAWAGRREI